LLKLLFWHLFAGFLQFILSLLCCCCLPRPKWNYLYVNCKIMLMVCKGETAGTAMPQMMHRQSLPNLSRSSKLSVATTARSNEPQRATPTRRALTQPSAAANSYKLQSQLKQPTQGASKAVPARHQASPARDFKSRAVREQSPSSPVLPAKAGGTARQASRLAAPNRCCVALLISRWFAVASVAVMY